MNFGKGPAKWSKGMAKNSMKMWPKMKSVMPMKKK